MSNYKMETKCVQSGYNPGNGEPRVLPIVQSTTFRYTSSDQMGRLFDLEESGYFYTRLQNPTNDAVAAKICDMEGGVAAIGTGNGCGRRGNRSAGRPAEKNGLQDCTGVFIL